MSALGKQVKLFDSLFKDLQQYDAQSLTKAIADDIDRSFDLLADLSVFLPLDHPHLVEVI